MKALQDLNVGDSLWYLQVNYGIQGIWKKQEAFIDSIAQMPDGIKIKTGMFEIDLTESDILKTGTFEKIDGGVFIIGAGKDELQAAINTFTGEDTYTE